MMTAERTTNNGPAADLESAGGEGCNGADSNNHSASKELDTISRFIQLLTSSLKIQNASCSKRENYRHLMGKLKNERDVVVRLRRNVIVLALFVLCGLTAALVWTLSREGRKEQPLLRCKITAVMMLTFGYWAVKFFTFLVFWPIKRRLLMHRYAVYLIQGLKGSVDVSLYLCMVVVCAHFWILPRLNIWIIPDSQVTWFLVALCIGSVLWLLKNLYCLMLEAQLRYLKLFDRIRLSIPFLHATHILKAKEEAAVVSSNKSKLPSGSLWMRILKMERDSVPLQIIRLLSEEYLDFAANSMTQHIIKSEEVKDEFSLILAATQKFLMIKDQALTENDWNLQEISRHTITVDDMKAYQLEEEELEEIRKLCSKIEDDEQDDEETDEEKDDEHSHRPNQEELKLISFHKFCTLVVKGLKTCWYLKQNLEGSIKLFMKLNRLLNAFVILIVLISWLLLSQIVSTGQVAVLFSPFLAASFIFGDSLKNMFQGLVFAFAMHAFEVGDVAILDNVKMRVREVNILTSCFEKLDTGEEVVIPNSTLMTTIIINAGEEVNVPSLRDVFQFDIDAQTPPLEIQDLKKNIETLLRSYHWIYKVKVEEEEFGKERIMMKVTFSHVYLKVLPPKMKALYKSRISRVIVRLTKEMEINTQKYAPSYTMKIRHKGWADIEDIENIEAEIMRGVEKPYRRYYKVVILEVSRRTIKMGIYVPKNELKIHDPSTSTLNWKGITRRILKLKRIEVIKLTVLDKKGQSIVNYKQADDGTGGRHRHRGA